MSASHHMLRQPAAPAPTAIMRREAKATIGWTSGAHDDHADERGEDDEEHHPRLQKRDEIRDIALGQARSRDGFATGLG